ncbi:diguanylate cyclase [Pseudomonas sp.]|uniref:sensor domain-containing diguanylate cyclase n=1 Tax=Pseudomonas sp. TaxID=306 RepID=UPI0028A9E468|nr:diguanylate cyclase [Pseudomonas sp.]
MFRRCSIETKAGLIAVVALTVTLLPMWLTLHAWLKHERQLVQQAAGNDAMNLAVAFEEHVHSVVRYADALLLDTREHLETDPDAFRRLVHRELHRDGNMVAQFALTAANGRLTESSIQSDRDVDLSDREHFRVHRDNPGRDQLFVSKPVLGRVSGIWSIQLTRAVFKHGTFDGVLVLSMPVAFFTDFYKQINVGQRGLIALVGLDGVPRAAASKSTIAGRLDTMIVPADRPYFDPRLPTHGFYFGPSALDQTERLTAYRRLADAGLVVLVQLSPADYLAAAEERRQFLQFCAAAISALLLAFAAYLYFATRRHLTNTAALRTAHDSLQQIINIDLLTGARSRRDFLATLDNETTRAQRHLTPLSLVLLDIDLFKRVNDTYGHPIGDVVLKRLSEMCRDMLRGHDVFGRLGGEEFGLILPHTDGDSAMLVAEKLREVVERTVIDTERGPIRISLSAGIASADQVAYDPGRLIVRADDALYTAKQTGRNKVCMAPAEENPASLGGPEQVGA